jgi:hypothetical protein
MKKTDTKYPFEKLKLDRQRLIKALDKVEKDIADLQQTKLYLLREIKINYSKADKKSLDGKNVDIYKLDEVGQTAPLP